MLHLECSDILRKLPFWLKNRVFWIETTLKLESGGEMGTRGATVEGRKNRELRIGGATAIFSNAHGASPARWPQVGEIRSSRDLGNERRPAALIPPQLDTANVPDKQPSRGGTHAFPAR